MPPFFGMQPRRNGCWTGARSLLRHSQRLTPAAAPTGKFTYYDSTLRSSRLAKSEYTRFVRALADALTDGLSSRQAAGEDAGAGDAQPSRHAW